MFAGSMVALVTPMQNDSVDIVALQNLVELHIASGTTAIIAAGTTGESGTLSYDEKLLVIKTVIEQAQERIPVIAGTAANSTHDCIMLTRAAMNCGAHAALIMTPAYIKPTQEGLYRHYSVVAQAAAMPIILYNVPSRTACDLLPETVRRLAKTANIIGIKDATGDIKRLQQLLTISDFDIYSGDDETAIAWILSGARGVISVTANVIPKMMATVCELALKHEQQECLAMNQHLLPLHQLLFIEANPIPVKWLLSNLGIISNELRLPMLPLDVIYQEKLLNIFNGIMRSVV